MSAKIATSIVCAALALVAPSVHGAIQRTFVASNGADSNPCTLGQPCRSFGTAIGKTLAGGEVIVADSAGYGTVTITQSVSIIAPTGVYAGVSVPVGQTGVTVNGVGIIVVLRGLTINGVGGNTGVQFTQGARLRIESCVVSNLASSAIVHAASGGEMIVLDSIIRDNGGAGILAAVDGTSLIDGTRVEHNAGDGIQLSGISSSAFATIRNSTMLRNGQAGVAVFIPNAPAETEVTVENAVLSYNGGDGLVVGGTGPGLASVTLRRSAVGRNGSSGVSAFGLGTGVSKAYIVETTFQTSPVASIAAQGGAEVYVTRNYFQGAGYSIVTADGAGVFTTKDNTGHPFSIGPPPSPVSSW